MHKAAIGRYLQQDCIPELFTLKCVTVTFQIWAGSRQRLPSGSLEGTFVPKKTTTSIYSDAFEEELSLCHKIYFCASRKNISQ